MSTKKSNRPSATVDPPVARLKAERIQLALLSLPGWALGAPRERVERFFRLAPGGEADLFVPFVLGTCREEGASVEMSVQESLVVVRLGGGNGVTPADLRAARTLSDSRWQATADTQPS